MVATITEEQLLNILIVEDDDDTAEVVSIVLSDAGFQTQAVDRGRIALSEIANQTPDLVLLDLVLPDMHGLQVLEALRSHSSLPLIILSGHGTENDRIHALNAGADDYLTKPFNPEELVARIRALLRRVAATPTAETTLQVRQLSLDLSRRQAFLQGKKLNLTPTEYNILLALVRHAGKTLTHDELISAVWGDEIEDPSVLRVNISRLRQKIEENPRHPRYIITVPNEGYILPKGG